MKVTVNFLVQKFNEFNPLYFNNELKIPYFRITKTKSILGRCSCGKLLHIIEISDYFDREEKDICNTLLHEMIHLYIFQKCIFDTSNHGVIFKQHMKRINKFGWNVSVRGVVTSNVKEEYVRKKRLNILLHKKLNGKFYVAVVSPKSIDKVDFFMRNRKDVFSFHSWFTVYNNALYQSMSVTHSILKSYEVKDDMIDKLGLPEAVTRSLKNKNAISYDVL